MSLSKLHSPPKKKKITTVFARILISKLWLTVTHPYELLFCYELHPGKIEPLKLGGYVTCGVELYLHKTYIIDKLHLNPK